MTKTEMMNRLRDSIERAGGRPLYVFLNENGMLSTSVSESRVFGTLVGVFTKECKVSDIIEAIAECKK